MKISTERNIGFTIVELIVIITIIVILATIGYIYLSGNLSRSRDSARLADIDNMQSGLNLYKVKLTSYPTPDGVVYITYSGSNVWSQGTFGSGVIQRLSGFSSKVPTDPLYNNNYTYSINNDFSSFQIGAILESSDDPKTTSFDFGVAKTYAAGQESTYISGNYNGVFTRTKTGSLYYFITTPSIIATETSNPDLAYILANKKISFNGLGNFPSSYKGMLTSSYSYFFSTNNPLVYSGSKESLFTYANLSLLNNALKNVYSGSILATNPKYSSFLKTNSVKSVKGILEKSYDYKWEYYLNCQDIQDSGASHGDDNYNIDTDGKGPSQMYSAFCSFGSATGVREKIGGSKIRNGDFGNGNGIPTESGSNPNNTIVAIQSPVSSGYAVHQYCNVGWTVSQCSSSEYEIHMENINGIKPGYEIWMSAWVADAWDGGSGGYIFHNRLSYSDGTTSTNGEPIETLETKTVNGKIWKLQRVRHVVQKDPTSWSWYIGYGAEDSKDLYFTGVDVQIYKK